MNKVVFLSLIALFIAGGAYYFFVRDRGDVPTVQEAEDEQVKEEIVAPEEERMSKADRERLLLGEIAVNIPDIDVQTIISGGRGVFDAGERFEGFILLGEQHASALIDGEEFILAHASLNTGGTGIFDYIFVFRVDGESLVHTSSAHIGDLIVVRGLKVGEKRATQADGARAEVIVDILDRDENEPLVVDPTVERRFVFTLSEKGILDLRTRF